jgi:hypothetical protein
MTCRIVLLNTALFTAACFLSGCVGGYKVSPAETFKYSDQGYATIQPTRIANNSVMGASWTAYTFSDIQPSFLTKSEPIDTYKPLVPLADGMYFVTVKVFDFISLPGGNSQRTAEGQVYFVAEPKKSYALTGMIVGDSALVWIDEINTYKRVTEEVSLTLSAPSVTRYGAPPVFIPLIIK